MRIRDYLPAHPLRIGLGVTGLATLVAYWAPYGTSQLGWPGVWYFWMLMMVSGWTSGLAVEVGLRRWCPSWPAAGVYSLCATAASLVVILATLSVHLWRGVSFSPGDLASMMFEVLVLVCVLTGLYGVWREGVRPDAARAASPTLAAGAVLRSQLPLALQDAAIRALASEDHYLRVYTAAGEALIRMRMRDALAAVAGLDGLQTHRSWWVGRSAVEQVRRVKGKLVLRVKGELDVPVSRTFLPALRKAGWLGR